MMLVSMLIGIGSLAADAPNRRRMKSGTPEVKPADELDKLRELIARDMQAAEKSSKTAMLAAKRSNSKSRCWRISTNCSSGRKIRPRPVSRPWVGQPRKIRIGRPIAIAAEPRRNVITA